MSVPAPQLAIVPPSPAASPPAAKPARISRDAVRRVALGAVLIACALPPPAMLVSPFIGVWTFLVFGLCFVAVLPFAGLMLGISLLVNRKAPDGVAVVAALLALAGCIASLAPAERAAVELYVAANAPELERLASDARAAANRLPNASQLDERGVLLADDFGGRTRRLGIETVQANASAIFFRFDTGGAFRVMYVDGSYRPTCPREHLRFLGGRFYATTCPVTPADANDD